MRWLIAIAIVAASCSLVTDFNPGRGSGGAGGSGGGGGVGGRGGSGGGGSGGSGGQPHDAAVDRVPPDGPMMPPDASIDARIYCTSDPQCADSFYCTVDYCDLNGICQHTRSNARCATPSQCVIDSCNPQDPMHDDLGCLHTPVNCPMGQVCDPQIGCVIGNCVTDTDCTPPDCCTTVHCSSHQCRTANSCSTTQSCCRALNGTCLGCLDVCPVSP